MKWRAKLRVSAKFLFGAFFIGSGLNHFISTDFYLSIMPPYLPWHLPLVYASGIAEAALGALLLVRRWSTIAAWGLIVLLIAVFPANVHMALNATLYPQFSPILLWLRLPVQAVLVAWAWLYTRGND
ncbi:MAG TPA: hypothetical protein VNA44_04845 [Burkholderiaceae bacterium]|nr:hypothetical protein [Burkholderiaceae bacterium]